MPKPEQEREPTRLLLVIVEPRVADDGTYLVRVREPDSAGAAELVDTRVLERCVAGAAAELVRQYLNQPRRTE